MVEYVSYMKPETTTCHIPQEDLENTACIKGIWCAPESCPLWAEPNVGDAVPKLGSLVTAGMLGSGIMEVRAMHDYQKQDEQLP